MADTFFGIPGAGQDNDAIAKAKSSGQITDAMRQAGAAYSNKRQSDRDFYGNALGNQGAAYQGAMNMLGASGGGAPSLAGMDRNNNPLTLQGTTIGGTAGSNSMGYRGPSPGGSPGGAPQIGVWNNGIQDYLGGTEVHDSRGTGNTFNLPDNGARNGTGGSINTSPQGGGQVVGSATAPMWAQQQPAPSGPPPSPGQNFNFGRHP